MTWSPQHYISQGVADGIDPILLNTAAGEISRMVFASPPMPAVLTLAHLAKRSGVSYPALRKFVVRSETNYAYFRIRKRSGGHRQISVPTAELWAVQKWIHCNILLGASAHPACYSFLPGKSICDCAAVHRGARWVIKIDISAFFGSVSERDVFDVFRRLGYRALIAFEMARIATDAPTFSQRYRHTPWRRHPGPYVITSYSQERVGYLPQGAPTSPQLSNLVMFDIDDQISGLARTAGLKYTRYSDDMTFSTSSTFSRKQAQKIIHRVAAIIRAKGFRLNAEKTRIIPPGGRQSVLGLLVDGAQPKLARKFRDNLRMHIFYMKKNGVQAHAENRGFDSVSGLYRHIKGLLDYSKSIDLAYWTKLSRQFSDVEWPSDWSAPS